MSLEVSIRKSFKSFTLNVQFDAGNETLGFLGASGCGKSLTMRCIAGIEKPDAGRIVMNGQVFFDSQRGINLKAQQRKTALLFQNYMLFPNLTVEQNVAAGIGKEVSRADRTAMVEAELSRFGLQGFNKRYPSQLSGGQQQRVAIARALALEPDILCFDEPTSALDPELTGEVLRVIKDLKSTGSTMIVVTHEMEFARNVSDKVLFMADGVVEESGTPEEVFGTPQSDKTKSFLNKSLESV